MKNSIKNTVIALACSAAGAAFAAPSYMPEGVQTNVGIGNVTGGGWTQCYVADFATPIGNNAESVLNACTGDYLLMAGRESGAEWFEVLAATLRSEAIFVTGQNSNTHMSNGANWWFAPNWSWGFTEADDMVNNNECDLSNSPKSMCLHTFSFVGGFRINNITDLNSSTGYEKVFYTASASNDVPEPATFALAGLALLGLGMQRARRVTAAR
jgi:hypothetical protein